MRIDPFGVAEAFWELGEAWRSDPARWAEKLAALQETLFRAGVEAMDGSPFPPGFPEAFDGDGRAAALALAKKRANHLRKNYSRLSGWMRGTVADAPGLDPAARRRCEFWMKQALSALNPGHYFPTNPAALQRFVDTDGESLIRGLENLQKEIGQGDGMVRLADDAVFSVGDTLAATPGRVVLRNELMELIQYAPTTDSVYTVPVVFIQPWINKFYIFDLTPANSFVRYMVDAGFTVFIISWKNPTAKMRDTGFADYLFRGGLAAVDAARDICGSPGVHAAGYCIGGTALAALMAWLNRGPGDGGNGRILDWTLFSSLTDFSEPGELGVFISEGVFDLVDALTAADGYLDARYIGAAFRMLNPDGLIWRYVVNNYLYGQPPPKSDMLYWNSDGTRLPAAMCSFYLREFYGRNRLTEPDGLTFGGRPIDLRSIRQPAYIVGAAQDHISPWRGTFTTCGLVGGPVRYVLASEGHITGIVNPPSARSKKKYWAGAAGSADEPGAWLEDRSPVTGTWWPDWASWLTAHRSDKTDPPPMGSPSCPPGDTAPGKYVLEK